VFREAGLDDLKSVLCLYGQLNPDDPVIDVEVGSAIFQKIEKNPDLHLFVLECDASIVASTYLNVIPNLSRSASPYAVIENVVVEQSRRGTGLGKQIMAGTLQFAWSAGCYKAMLMTGSKRPSTHGFYRACGFSGNAKTAYLARPN
jgi:GNAT superfamily N-acetyltransferase